MNFPPHLHPPAECPSSHLPDRDMLGSISLLIGPNSREIYLAFTNWMQTISMGGLAALSFLSGSGNQCHYCNHT